MNPDLNFEARYTENYAFLVFQLSCILLQNKIEKCPFCLRTNNSFLFFA